MSKVFIVKEESLCVKMDTILCKNEDKELQQLLENNLDLIPGDQINPEEPRRWLKIRREMPVEDPNTGSSRWSIDFLLVDQSGILTFVECKRYQDSRSRREVVGQMLDYAANGQFYWNKEVLRKNIELSANDSNPDINEIIMNFHPESGDSVEDFLDRVENNLNEGIVRLIFFMEEAPLELKSIVEFLNKQMERTEVLIVEAKQFIKDNIKVVVPYLFGYTEQARRIKKKFPPESPGKRVWNYDEFIKDTEKKNKREVTESIKKLFQLFSNYQYKFGTGVETGSLNLILPKIHNSNALISICTNGRIYFNYNTLKETELDISFKDKLFKIAIDLEFGHTEEMKQKSPSIPSETWGKESDKLIQKIEELIAEFW